MRVAAEAVTWGVDGQPIVRGVDLDVPDGAFVGLVGPNGSGKTSLLRCVYRVLTPDAGLVTVGGDDVRRMAARELARRMAVVPQDAPTEFAFTVAEMVAMGRSPHKGPLELDGEGDRAIVLDALARVGLAEHAERSVLTLSGGERQRVVVARSLAQHVRVLILDEPTNHLDVRYQFEVLELVRDLGVTVVAALHDLNLAAAYCDRIYLLQAGAVVAAGTPEEVLVAERLEAVFGVGALVEPHPVTGRPRISFYAGSRGTSRSRPVH